MIYLTVGTYPPGFDRLVEAVDNLCAQYNIKGYAQISGGSYKPKHMLYQKFYSSEEQSTFIENSDFIISHGGFGVIGDILRQGSPLLVFPRPPAEGPNDQRPVAKKLAELFGFTLCQDIDDLKNKFAVMTNSQLTKKSYNLESDIPSIITDYLKSI